MSLASYLARISKGERGVWKKIISLSAGIGVFLVLLPALFIVVAQFFSSYIHFSLPRHLEYILAIISVVAGLSWLAWAALEQWFVGRGTPAQSAPTQKLITSGPYAACRNPIELGAIFYYFGIGTLFGSVWHGIVSLTLGLCLGSFYHKKIEEDELERRFGATYTEYRMKTPFLIPRLWCSKNKKRG
jgi:protein-S-isoprenylcysteine O-methyltransferase Ste14